MRYVDTDRLPPTFAALVREIAATCGASADDVPVEVMSAAQQASQADYWMRRCEELESAKFMQPSRLTELAAEWDLAAEELHSTPERRGASKAYDRCARDLLELLGDER